MRTYEVAFPELAFVAMTRALAGVGIGLLAGKHLAEERRTAIGWTLLAVGVATTLPIVWAVRNRLDRQLPRPVGAARLAPPKECDD